MYFQFDQDEISALLANSAWQFERANLRLLTVLGEGNFGKVRKKQYCDVPVQYLVQKESYFTRSMFGDCNSLFQVIYSSSSMLSEYIVFRDVDGLLNIRRRNRNHALSQPPHTFLLRLKRKAEPLKIPPKVFLIPPRSRKCAHPFFLRRRPIGKERGSRPRNTYKPKSCLFLQ